MILHLWIKSLYLITNTDLSCDDCITSCDSMPIVMWLFKWIELTIEEYNFSLENETWYLCKSFVDENKCENL